MYKPIFDEAFVGFAKTLEGLLSDDKKQCFKTDFDSAGLKNKKIKLKH
jgi:hypothetical protein